MAAQGRPGPGPWPRLPRRRRGQGDPVRDLRPGRERRLGERRAPITTPPDSRSSRSAAGGTTVGQRRLPGHRPAADHRGRRRLQRLPTPGAGRPSWPRLAPETGLAITVCHLPPGTSKWNKIEHRLFSRITMNWRGRPLTSHEVIVESIAATTTRTGLTVRAELDPGTYPRGIRSPEPRSAPCPSPATTGTASGTTPCAPNPPHPSPNPRHPAPAAPPGPTPPSPDWTPPPGTSSSPASTTTPATPTPSTPACSASPSKPSSPSSGSATAPCPPPRPALRRQTRHHPTAQNRIWPLLIQARPTPPGPQAPRSEHSPTSPATPTPADSPSPPKQRVNNPKRLPAVVVPEIGHKPGKFQVQWMGSRRQRMGSRRQGVVGAAPGERRRPGGIAGPVESPV